MQQIRLKKNGSGPLKVLCLGAHCDDIEIGCGGAMLRLIGETPDLAVRWIVFAGSPQRQEEARRSAADLLQAVPDKRIEVKAFRESYFPWVGDAIKDAFEVIRREFEPDLVFTHHKEDAHQDHRVIADLTWNTFRNHLILEYEIPKYEGDMGNPNVFIPIPEAVAERKLAALREHFTSQHGRAWFTDDTFHAMLRLRGVAANSESGLAEGFHCRKLVF